MANNAMVWDGLYYASSAHVAALWVDSLLPVAGLFGMMGEGDNSDHLATCYGHNGERESLKNQSFCSQLGSLASH